MSSAEAERLSGGALRELRLLRAAVLYELAKVSVFRTGFVVREVLRGLARPAVMIFVYAAIFRQDGIEALAGWTLAELVHYMILVATFQKVLFPERGLDLADQIFDGYVTKYFVMPVRFFTLALGRFVQFSAVQVLVAALFFACGALCFPTYWPRPASALAALQACVLVGLGSACFFLLFYVLNVCAFWLDVVWSLLVMARFVTLFISGFVVPISMFPEPVRAAFAWLFPYWTLSAPIEIFLGRMGTPEFLRGAGVLALSLIALDRLRAALWRRGTLRYTGSGM